MAIFRPNFETLAAMLEEQEKKGALEPAAEPRDQMVARLKRSIEENGIADAGYSGVGGVAEDAVLPDVGPKVSMTMGDVAEVARVPREPKITGTMGDVVEVGRVPQSLDVVRDVAGARDEQPLFKSSGEPRPVEVSDEEKMRRAMEYAKKQASGDENMANLQAATRNWARERAGLSRDNEFANRAREQALRPVGQLEKDQGLQRSKYEKVKEALLREKEAALRAEQVKADDARGDRQLTEAERHNRVVEATQAADAASRAKKFKNTGGYGKNDKEAKKEALRDEELIVPGYNRPDGGPRIKVEEAMAMRDAIEAQDAINGLADQMYEAKLGPNGTGREFLPGADKDAQEGIASGMLFGLKNLAKTGVLDAQTERIARSFIPQPSDGKAAAETKLKQFKSYVAGMVSAKAKARGYVKDAEESAAPSGGSEKAGGMVKMIGPDGAPGWVAADEVEQAKKNKYRLAADG